MLTNLDALDIAAEETATPILAFPRPAHAPKQFYLKVRRFLDFAIGVSLTLIALPIVALAALAVKLTSRGPVFYTQTRVGRGGRAFTIYKVRTMIDKCESLTGPRWTIPGDPRVTPIGWLLRRTHIDELPQLLNVLKGQMSLIGPRRSVPNSCASWPRRFPITRYATPFCPASRVWPKSSWRPTPILKASAASLSLTCTTSST